MISFQHIWNSSIKAIFLVLLKSNSNGEQNEIFVLGFLYLIILHLFINVKAVKWNWTAIRILILRIDLEFWLWVTIRHFFKLDAKNSPSLVFWPNYSRCPMWSSFSCTLVDSLTDSGDATDESVEKKPQEEPELTPNNVVSILVSASFLKMGPLVDYALMYLHQNMNKVLVTTHNLNCLGEPLLTR